MKKYGMICMLLAFLLMLCACGGRKTADVTIPVEGTVSAEGKYQPLIDKLEAGDYDGARSMIDAMEAAKLSGQGVEETEETLPEQTSPAETTQPPEIPAAAGTGSNRVELTTENVQEYFHVTVNFFHGPKPGFEVGLALKEEYAMILTGVEEAAVKVTYLTADAYGTLDTSGEFLTDRYVITSEDNLAWVEISQGGLGSMSNGSYVQQGYFPEFPVDVALVDGRGFLVFSE